jgi:outer membrane receptor protein involved in Fe transport
VSIVRKSWLRAFFVVLIISLASVGASANESAAQSFRFDIPAGSLAQALGVFQTVTGAKVAIDASLAGLWSPGVSGVFTTSRALDQLLSGTGLIARLTAVNTFSVEIWVSPERVEVTAATTPYRTEGSQTATKTLTPLRDIPQTLNVIPRELLVDQGAQSIAAAMKNVPGVSVAQGEGNRDQIVLRGINTATDFFVNGIRDDQERFRDLYNVETVEVVQGPAAVLFGRGGGGGVVNLVTQSPLAGAPSEVSLEFGRFDHKRGTMQLGGKLGANAGFRVSAVGERSGGFRDGYFLQRYGVNPSVGMRLDNSTVLTVAYEHLSDRRLADRGIPSQAGKPVDVPASQFFGSTSQSGVSARTCCSGIISWPVAMASLIKTCTPAAPSTPPAHSRYRATTTLSIGRIRSTRAISSTAGRSAIWSTPSCSAPKSAINFRTKSDIRRQTSPTYRLEAASATVISSARRSPSIGTRPRMCWRDMFRIK